MTLAYVLIVLTAWLVVGFIVAVVFGSMCRVGEYHKAKEPGGVVPGRSEVGA